MEDMRIMNHDAITLNGRFKTKKQVLDFMIQNLKEKDYISDSVQFRNDIDLRESLTSTVIGEGVAIPHAQSSSVLKPIVAFLRNDNPIMWDGIASNRVKFIFMFVVSDTVTEKKNHLAMLQKIAVKLAKQDTIQAIEHCETINEFMEIMDV